MLVDGIAQFLFDVCQASEDRLPLLLGEMEAFVGIIREEGIIFYQSREGRAAQELGVEAQGPSLGLVQATVVFRAHHLPGGDEEHRAASVVILAAAVPQGATIGIFQQYGIDMVELPAEAQGLGLVPVDDADQRVRSLYAEVVVVGLDGVDLEYGGHGVFSFKSVPIAIIKVSALGINSSISSSVE